MEKKQIRSVFNRVGLGLAVFFLGGQLLLPILFSIVTGMVAPEFYESGLYTWVSTYLPMYLIAFPLVLLIWRGIPNSTPVPARQEKLPVKAILLLIAVGMGVTLSLNYLGMGIAALLAMLRGTDAAVNGLAVAIENSNVWFNFLIVGIVAPVMEEIMLRGLLYKKLIRFGGATYCVISALMFSLMHANFYQLAYAFILGLVWAYVVYLDGGRIRYTVLLHVCMNVMGGAGSNLLMTYLPESAFMVYNVFLLALGAVGLIVGIVWLVKRRRSVSFAPAEVALPSKGITLANVGMILYLVATLGIVVFQLFIF